MIPKIIHQTWKTHDVPENCRSWIESWKTLNPEWKHILWSDDELDEFVSKHYPDFLTIFRGYKLGVQRADAARYLLLHHFGGVYTDIDTECLMSLDIFANEDRIVFCDEPKAHSANYITARGLERMIFNGTMASPAQHPFWLDLLKNLERNHYSSMVLDSTGPMILSATVQKHRNQNTFSFNSPHLYCGKAVFGKHLTEKRTGDYSNFAVSIHHWIGTWYKQQPSRKMFKIPLLKKANYFVRLCVYTLTRGKQYLASINRSLLAANIAPPTNGETISVLIPVRDGEAYIKRCMELLGALDWPKSQLHITFCEGDSRDGTVAALAKIIAENKFEFGSISLIHKTVNTNFTRKNRTIAKLQRQRRAGLAVVRNHLIEHAIKPETDWALWIDIDVNDYQPSILRQLLAEQEKIIVPHCIRDDGSNNTFDLNSFVSVYEKRDNFYFKHVIGGLYQPPSATDRRIHLGDVRYHDKISLNGVGGTMLLVHADVHRAGLVFPDLPYKDLIETEAFGQLARDYGVTPIGMPNLTITHPV